MCLSHGLEATKGLRGIWVKERPSVPGVWSWERFGGCGSCGLIVTGEKGGGGGAGGGGY